MGSIQRPHEVSPEDQEILARFGRAVERFCRSRSRSYEDAEDATQDTFCRFIRRSTRNLENPEAWLIRVASRACVDIHRRNATADSMSTPVLPDSDSDGNRRDIADPDVIDPEELVAQRELIRQILRRLSERERLVLTQLYVHDCSYEQLAKFLGQSVPYTRVLAQRARDHARSVATNTCRPQRRPRRLIPRLLPLPTPNGGLSKCLIELKSLAA